MGLAAKLRVALYLPLAALVALVLLLRDDPNAPSAEPDDRPPPIPVMTAEAGPTMIDFGGQSFDLAATGDFVLAMVDSPELEVHGRIRRAFGSRAVDRVGVSVNYHWVQLRPGGRPIVDQRPVEIPPGYQIDLGRGAAVTRWGDAYTVDGPGQGARAQIRVERDRVRVRLPRGRAVGGLLAPGTHDPRRFRVAEDESLVRDTDD